MTERSVVLEIDEDEVGAGETAWWKWTFCGHRVPALLPMPGYFIAVGNNDPCPECEGGQVPQEIPSDD